MEKRQFGKTGLEVSTLGFGAAPIGFLETEQENVARVLNELLDGGLNLIDTAAGYAGSEEMLGKTVAHRRNEFILVSKCGHGAEGLPGESWSPGLIAATVDRALKRLQTDHLDVMLLHTCDKSVLEQGEALEALVRARDAGKIRFAGFAGDNDAAAYAAGLEDISVVMASFNIVDQANIEALLPASMEHGVGVLAKRPVANAAWKAPEAQQGMYRNYAQPYHERFYSMGLSLDEFDVADWTELALRFTLSIPGVHSAVIGTTKVENARHNLAAAAKGPLTPESVDRIRAAFTQAGGASWAGLQ